MTDLEAPHGTTSPESPNTFMICGARPVFSALTAEGGLAVYAFDWETGEFTLDMSYLTRISGWPKDDDAEVTRAEFDEAVALLRQDLPDRRK